MSVWMSGFLLFVLLNSEVYAKDDQKPTIGEQLDVIIKDVSEYLLWLFGYGEESIEDQIEVSEILADSFVRDVNDMIELMNEEAEKHIKHAKDIRKIENDREANYFNEKEPSEEKKAKKEETSEDTSTSETEEKGKEDYEMGVIPI